MLSHWLIAVNDFATPESISLFQKDLPLDWINQTVSKTNKASIPRRKLTRDS
ncbi:hypothetical protein VSF3289_01426 [Vibrio scophthalmi]|uniref:Uncharacterized protein n=1 Tax=Vibrio scophthalmi TaxID=45658 RepID=A0A1E3WN09_9VIBR|nr:hypothetical protein VSF3289_01426 [Vibrio scophthalmi]